MKRPPVIGILAAGGTIGGVLGVAAWHATDCGLWIFAGILWAAVAAVAWETWVEIREARRSR